MLGLEGRSAIVTGGSQGIGFACADALARAGARVALVARRSEVLDEAVARIARHGREVIGVVGDVRERETTDRVVDETLAAFGHIDVLVNNAGASYADTFRRAPLHDLDVDDLRGAMDLNVAPAVALSTAVAQHMADRGGSIVNIASIVATHPMEGFGFYSAAKAALVNLTLLMALEWAPSVRVNAVLPGHIDTPRSSSRRTPEATKRLVDGIAMGRLGTPEDVAGAVVYFASDLASWTTGALLDVNGGLRAI